MTYQDGVTTPPVLRDSSRRNTHERPEEPDFRGSASFTLTVDEHGMSQNVHVARPIGVGLDGSAIKAVQQERFMPAMRGGRPVAFTFAMEVSFKPTP